MNIAFYLIAAGIHITGFIVTHPIHSWVLGTGPINISIILLAANRLAMLLGCVYALVALIALLKSRRKFVAEGPNLKMAGREYYSIVGSEPRKKEDKIGRYLNDEKLHHFHSVVNQFLLDKKPFLQQRYSLRELADDVDIPVNYLSAFINRYYKMNYSDFINRYRVSQSREMIMNGEWRQKTLEAIASESGFNNRNTFTAAFKKETGESPSEFLKSIKKEHRENKLSSRKAKRILV